ncbi:MAG TPA: folylpolyglutamate synthase/dihydrofolate synthase family protein [bacterium]|nr:folylpolyglutamate synthase/dihydrofolate synthase family protein [bacterium]
MTFSTSDDVYAYLDRFLNFERKLEPKAYRLDRMQALRELFGKPDAAYRVVHVAGSKGKGSTATMIASILGMDEPTVGLYTSPHLLHFTERIAINMAPVSEQAIIKAAVELSNRLETESPEDFPGGETPTYFELLTMLGFLCFRNAGCTSAAIEVGLGGRLDSTNIVEPVACAITPIELEHTDLLGTTIPAIASEKAGIIKSGVPSFTSATRPEALEVIRAKAQEMGSRLRVLDEEATIREYSISPAGTRAMIDWRDDSLFAEPLELSTPLIGLVQARNATLAAMVCRTLGSSVASIQRGIAGARLRARFEIITGDPVVVIDGAHTADSVRACADDFGRLFPAGGVLLFGCAKGKPPRPMADALSGLFRSVTVTRPGTFKESDPAEIAAAFSDAGYAITRIDDTNEAVTLALEDARRRGLPLLVTGSFYLCAAAAAIVDARNATH